MNKNIILQFAVAAMLLSITSCGILTKDTNEKIRQASLFECLAAINNSANLTQEQIDGTCLMAAVIANTDYD